MSQTPSPVSQPDDATPSDRFVDLHQFFTQPRLRIVAGKGGVGKTTVTAALARAAADVGLSVEVIDLEGRAELETLLGAPTDRTKGCGAIRYRVIKADQALGEYLRDHGLAALAHTMDRTGLTQVITRGAPGIKDILVLGKIKQLERAAVADVILVDAPASGHALTFLRAAHGLLEAVPQGAINQQAKEVLELLGDPARCEVVLVTLAEETPVSETIDTAFSLEEDVGIRLGPIVLNAVLPPIDLPDAAQTDAVLADACRAGLDETAAHALRAAATFRRHRHGLQADQRARLSKTLPLPQLVLPQRFSPELGIADIDALAAALHEGIEAL